MKKECMMVITKKHKWANPFVGVLLLVLILSITSCKKNQNPIEQPDDPVRMTLDYVFNFLSSNGSKIMYY